MRNKSSPNKATAGGGGASAASSTMPKSVSQMLTSGADLTEPVPGDRKAVFKRLEEDLTEQIRIAMRHHKNYINLGDVSNAKK
jgi:hypothetical protein